MNSVKVLIVDDHPIVREGMKLLIAESRPGLSLADLVVSLEQRFHAARNPEDPRCLYATGLFVRLDQHGELEYTSAGHPPMFVRRGTGVVETCAATGRPIALVPGPPPTSRSLHLAPADTVLLYTDGLVEVRTPDGAPLGLDALEARRHLFLDNRSDLILSADQRGQTQSEWKGKLDGHVQPIRGTAGQVQRIRQEGR